ncbi:MAG: sulfatase, partial [bacterium]|nr:sulfatase [bacterium]
LGAAARGEKPNIVFILADDLGWHQLGAYGSRFYETPHIDRLAREGMKFTNAYAAAPVCSPTRASIVTGKYPARLHLTDYIPGRAPTDKKPLTPEWTKHLPLSETTIAEVLKKAGYATGHFGKWHLNRDKNYEPGRPGDPQSQGFDDVLTTHKPRAGPPSRYDEDWHHVREITERAVAFIGRNKENPFFCYVVHNSIHDPEIEKPELVRKYEQRQGAQKRGRENPVQAAMLETLDASVGTIVKTIGDLGLDRETLVVFFSDNGQKGSKEGKPFRGSKGDLYEAGIRMPLIFRWPGVIEPGSVSDEVVTSTDFFPTFAKLAGAEADLANLDGLSLAGLLRDPQARLGRDAVYWHFPHYHSLGLGPQGAIREGRYKLIEWFEELGDNRALELYDLSEDPGETRNLAGGRPEVRARLRDKLHRWREQVNAQMMAT